MKTPILILLASLSFCSISFSQVDQEIEEIEIISLPVPIEVDKTGRSITIIDSETLNELPVSSVEEALRTVAGININSRGGFGVQSDIGLRGSTFSQVLILIDGLRWNESLTAHLNNTIPVPLHEIESIEVIRGSASALYGSDAVGGVIHIHTKTMNSTWSHNQFNTQGSSLFGEYALANVDGIAQLIRKNWTVSGGLKYLKSTGQEFDNPNFEAGISEEEYYSSDFKIQNFTLATSVQPTEKIRLSGRYAQDSHDFDAHFFYTASNYDESREKTDTKFGQVKAEFDQEQGKTMVNLGFKETKDNFVFNPLFPANNHTTTQFTGVINQQWQTKKDHRFALGAQMDQQDIESTDRGNHKQQQYEVFGTGSLQLGEDWSTMLSLRGGHNSTYGFTLVPQASVAYAQKNVILRSSIGQAVRGADFTERFVSYNIQNLSPGRNIGNPDLTPERSTTVDLGTDIALKNDVRFSSTIFYRNSKALIDYTIVNADDITNVNNLQPGENYFQAQNVGRVQTFGIEFFAHSKFKIGRSGQLTITPNYTFLHTSFAEDQPSKYLANHPNHELNLLFGYKNQQFSMDLTNQFVSRNAEALAPISGDIPSIYWLSNASLSYSVLPQLGITGRWNNVFNQNYQEILGARMPGSWLSAGFNWDFDK